MEMKNYLIETFMFNDDANRKILDRIKQLPDREMCVKYFSHLINSQIKWLARIQQYPKDPGLDWWEPVYNPDDLEWEWEKSLTAWIEFLNTKTEEELFSEVKFIGFDGSEFGANLKDIALQLNYHSIHHRAQIQTIIRQQGLTPDFIDYIGTKYYKLKI